MSNQTTAAATVIRPAFADLVRAGADMQRSGYQPDDYSTPSELRRFLPLTAEERDAFEQGWTMAFAAASSTEFRREFLAATGRVYIG